MIGLVNVSLYFRKRFFTGEHLCESSGGLNENERRQQG